MNVFFKENNGQILRALFIIFFIFSTDVAYGQHNNDLNFKKIPPSPVSSKFSEYIASAPNMENGNINIPIDIFKLDYYDFQMPLKLVYSSNGITLNDTPIPYGYGWNLTLNPRINRTIYNRPDEKYPFKNFIDYNAADWSTRAPWHNQEDFPEFYDPLKTIVNDDSRMVDYQLLSEDLFDSQKDIFTIQLPHKSINFILIKTENTTTAYSFGNNIKIYLNIVNLNIRGIKVVDDDGVIYKFGNFDNENGNSFIEEYAGNTTSWLLRDITLNNNERIDFQWVKNNISLYKPQMSSSISMMDFKNSGHPNLHTSGHSGEPSPLPEINDYGGVINLGEYQNPYFASISKIISSAWSVDFFYKSINEPYATKIEVKDFNNTLINTVLFTYGGTNPQFDHYLLKNLKINDEIYEFQYNNKRFANSTNSLDYWGFYNGKIQNSQVPRFHFKAYNVYSAVVFDPANSSIYAGVANKEVDTVMMKAFMLEKIIYPTKGYTKFYYEPHQFQYSEDYPGLQSPPSQITMGGGLRIKKILNYLYDGTLASEKYYKYGINENGLAKIKLVPTPNTFVDETWHWNYYSTYTLSHRNVNIKPLSDYQAYDFGKSSIWYEQINEYTPDTKKTLRYIFKDDEINILQGFKLFSKKFTSEVYSIFQGGPQLLEETIYNKVNGQFVQIKKRSLDYEWFSDLNAFDNLLVNRRITSGGVYVNSGNIDPVYPNFITIVPIHNYTEAMNNFKFNYNFYKIFPGIYRITNERIYSYTPQGEIVELKTYSYTNNYIKSIIKNSSNSNTTIIEEYKYPFEDTSSINQIMTDRNMLNKPNEQKLISNNSITLQEEIYSNNLAYPSNLILLKEKRLFINGILSKYLMFSKYDKYGNPLQVQLNQLPPVSYLYGYKGLYPIAKVENSSYVDITNVLNESIIASLNLGNVSESYINSTLLTLRNVLNNSFVSNYTYKPLLGMSSETDPRNNKYYYSYDNFGRLSSILDFDNFYLKSYQYNLKATTYTNTAKSRTFIKNNCTIGQVGSSVVYSVVAGFYSSTISQEDADQLAINDVNSNGQSYANLHGTCSAPTLTIPIQRSTGWNGIITRITFYQNNNQVAQIFPQNNGDLETSFDIESGTYSRIRVDIDPSGAPYHGYLNIFNASGVMCNDIGLNINELNFYNVTFNPAGDNRFLIFEGCLY